MTTKTILLADDDVDLLAALERRCTTLGLHVITVTDALAAINKAIAHRPDAICIDVNLPGGNGLAASEIIQSHEQLSSIPLIVITGEVDEGIQKRCHELSVYYVPKTGDTWQRLEPLLGELLNLDSPPSVTPTATKTRTSMATDSDAFPRHAVDPAHSTNELLDVVFELLDHDPEMFDDAQTERKPWVLCIDDDFDFSNVLSYRLEQLGVGVINAYDGHDGIKTAFTHTANAIILDYNMPNGDGDEVLRRLKKEPSARNIPVIALTGNRNEKVRTTMLNLGADSFLYKPVEFDRLVAELRRYIHIPDDGSSGLLAAQA